MDWIPKKFIAFKWIAFKISGNLNLKQTILAFHMSWNWDRLWHFRISNEKWLKRNGCKKQRYFKWMRFPPTYFSICTINAYDFMFIDHLLILLLPTKTVRISHSYPMPCAVFIASTLVVRLRFYFRIQWNSRYTIDTDNLVKHLLSYDFALASANFIYFCMLFFLLLLSFYKPNNVIWLSQHALHTLKWLTFSEYLLANLGHSMPRENLCVDEKAERKHALCI